MYLHLGAAAVVPFQEVIGVFDLDHVTSGRDTRAFLERAEAAGSVTALGGRIPVSLVVTDGGAFLSPLSAPALCRRLAEERWE